MKCTSQTPILWSSYNLIQPHTTRLRKHCYISVKCQKRCRKSKRTKTRNRRITPILQFYRQPSPEAQESAYQSQIFLKKAMQASPHSAIRCYVGCLGRTVINSLSSGRCMQQYQTARQDIPTVQLWQVCGDSQLFSDWI